MAIIAILREEKKNKLLPLAENQATNVHEGLNALGHLSICEVRPMSVSPSANGTTP